MAETMGALIASSQVKLVEVERAVTARRWSEAQAAARSLLSDMSKLHQRLRSLEDVAAEAGIAAAEVDRALKRAEEWHQTTVEEQAAKVEAKEAAARMRKSRQPGKKGG